MSDLRISKADQVATVTIDRPPVNALTPALFDQISVLFSDLGTSLDVNCVILTGSGTRAFCAGLDLREIFPATPEEDLRRRQAYSAIYHCQIPTIAAVNGPALGAGAILASVCDIRFAADNATFGLPEIDVGRCGGGSHIGRLVPPGALRRMAFTGIPISASEGHRLGLIDEVVKADQLQTTASSLASIIAAKSPLGLRYGKRALNRIAGMPLEEGYSIEQQYNAKLLETEDAKEAKRALIERRTPIFVGK